MTGLGAAMSGWEHRAKVAEMKLEAIYRRALVTEITAAELRGFCLGINAVRPLGDEGVRRSVLDEIVALPEDRRR